MILDLLIAAVIAVMVIIGVKRGLVASLYGLAATAVSFILARIISGAAADWIYRTFVYSSFSSEAQSQTDSLAASSQSVLDKMPDFAVGILNNAGINNDNFHDKVSEAGRTLSGGFVSAINAVVAPVITAALSIIFTVVLFLIFRFIFKLFSKRIIALFKLPVIKTVNSVFGGVLGFAEGVLICYLGVIICKLIICIDQDPLITEELINQSIIIKAAYNSDFINSVGTFVSQGNEPTQETTSAVPSIGESLPTEA